MTDDFGRVNPVSPQFLERDVHEKAYSGRHARKHQSQEENSPATETESVEQEAVSVSPVQSHIDLRI